MNAKTRKAKIRKKKEKRWLQILTVSSALLFAVANGEVMQGIANGSLSPEPFDKPAFLSWSAYNCFLLSWFPLKLLCRRSLKCSVQEFLLTKWASGSKSLRRMLLYSTVMQLLLLCINILWVMGLTHISVSTSNAIYQLQTGVTIGLSVIWLKHRFFMAEALGIGLSLMGVILIVVPPLLLESDDRNEDSDKRPWVGACATFLSALLWGCYQVIWRIMGKEDVSGLEGLMDTLTTLGVMGAVNLIAGWPLLLILHLTGLETFVLPAKTMVWSLVGNGLVEYAFDSSCALAIYFTSPIVTAITAPLTIPIALVWDGNLGNWFDWAGSWLVLMGVLSMELTPQLIGKKRNMQYELISPEVV